MALAVEGGLNPGDRVWVGQLERRQQAAAATAACATGDRCVSTASKILGVAEAISMVAPIPSFGKLKLGGAALRAAFRGGKATKGAARLSDDVARTFKGGSYSARTLDEDTTLHRFYGGSSGELGSYWSSKAYSSPGRAKQYLALPPGNTARKMVTIRVPAGSTIYEGKAAAAFGRRGGGHQVYVSRVNPDWIVR